MGIGKWIVGALGWATLGPLGGILGYILASRIEQLSEAVAQQGGTQPLDRGQRNSFLMSLLVLSAAVMKADGKITDKEFAKSGVFFCGDFAVSLHYSC